MDDSLLLILTFQGKINELNTQLADVDAESDKVMKEDPSEMSKELLEVKRQLKKTEQQQKVAQIEAIAQVAQMVSSC